MLVNVTVPMYVPYQFAQFSVQTNNPEDLQFLPLVYFYKKSTMVEERVITNATSVPLYFHEHSLQPLRLVLFLPPGQHRVCALHPPPALTLELRYHCNMIGLHQWDRR